MLQKKKRIKDRKLLNQIKQEKCLIDNNCQGPVDPVHITSRGAGGDDTRRNVFPGCRRHHFEIHKGVIKFIFRHPVFLEFLVKHKRYDILSKIELHLHGDDLERTLYQIKALEAKYGRREEAEEKRI